jgi:hypothetical protein
MGTSQSSTGEGVRAATVVPIRPGVIPAPVPDAPKPKPCTLCGYAGAS